MIQSRPLPLPRSLLLLLLGFASCTSPSTAPPSPSSARSAKPGSAGKLNVLFIVVDDLNADLACYGNPVVKTPALDRLAAWGVRFDRAYCQFPLCNPSRTSFLSGIRPDATGIFDNDTDPSGIRKPAPWMPEHFRANGYYAAGVGKVTHGAFRNAVRWDLDEADPAWARQLKRAQEEGEAKPKGAPGKPAYHPEGIPSKVSDDDESDGYIARRICELLEEHRNGPFFLAAGFHKPHLPWIAPKKYFDLYPPAAMPLPAGFPRIPSGIPPIALITDRTGFVPREDADLTRAAIAAYRACTSFVDAQIGRVLDTLDRLKLRENTVVVFFGDHGFHLGERGMWAKTSLYEKSARVPLLVAAPGRTAGAASPRLVELVDLYPTLCELAGIPIPVGLEGTSFAPLLDKPSRPWKSAAFTQVLKEGITGRSVCTDRYRFMDWVGTGIDELYDHQADPEELTNLAAKPEHAGTVAEMRRILAAGWRNAAPK